MCKIEVVQVSDHCYLVSIGGQQYIVTSGGVCKNVNNMSENVFPATCAQLIDAVRSELSVTNRYFADS